ncbi:MAG: Rpn family recombination-promoting nuclease/putative transposase, partial [Gammaproteobacteria bacterium]
MANIKNPHDKLFKISLSNVEIAKDFFKIHLPQSILDQIDLDNLIYCNNSYLEQDLEEKFSDVVYYSKNNSGQNSYLYILLEHQSTPDRLIPLRILKYQIA